MDDWIGGKEHCRVPPGLIDQIQITAKVDILHAGRIRIRKVNVIHDLEIRCLEDCNLLPELVYVFTIRRDVNGPDAKVALICPLFFLGDIYGFDDLLLL
jgi:hypothetical protein